MGSGKTYAQKLKRKRESQLGAPKDLLNPPNEAAPIPSPPTVAITATSKPVAVDTSKPTAVFQPIAGRNWTVSVALPGSIIANSQTHESRTSLAGHIARALSVFCIDEVIVFSDGNTHGAKKHHQRSYQKDAAEDEYTGDKDHDHFLTHLLSYLETPPHLRKLLFPIHANLRTAGTLPSLDLPHHLKSTEWCPYREGVTLPGADASGTYVEAGLRIPVTVPDQIPPNTRLTLKFDEEAESASKDSGAIEIRAEAINPADPREDSGYYWGFNVRKAAGLSDVFTECAYEGGYDVTIGTSERGVDVEDLYGDSEQQVGNFKHLLIVFGGVAGLEVAVKNDRELQKLGVTEAKDVFDRWINVCPGQGSRTIRTEEAVWIGLMGLRRLVVNNS